MKSPTIALPLLLQIALVVGLHAQGPTQPVSTSPSDRDAEIRELHHQLQQIESRLDVLENEPKVVIPRGIGADSPNTTPQPITPTATVSANEDALNFFHTTTFNFGVDGYYAYNFNRPIGDVNQLRAYDVGSNSFSINQASLMIEHLPEAEAGRRFGGRIDLQFGQATEASQGSSANELHPEVWRNLFQAYGSYLAPVGSGLQVDFGKWASTLGAEGNYTKDQINYSRSFLFYLLPFYHMGFRANYNITPKVNFAYWLVNGTQQTDDFNGFKSQAFVTTLKPAKTLTWNLNYYFGQEQPDSTATPLSPTPNGREHIFDSYATWAATPKLTLVGEADYVLNRIYAESAPVHVTGGALYARYALPRGSAIAARTEYLSDRGGFFSGKTQALKEFTITLEHQFEPGFLARIEYRRDFSNRHYFLTDRQGILSAAQPTATLGLLYWWGTKQGSW